MLNENWTQCPHGFVYPESPNDPRNIYVQGTDCAVSCRRPYFTDEQYLRSDNYAMEVSAMGFAIGSVLLCLWLCKPKRHPLIMTFIASSVLTSLSFLVIFFNSDIPMNEKFCYNNAIPLDYTEGVTLCVVQGAAAVFFSATLSLVWLAQTIDLYLTIVRGIKGTLNRYYYHYMLLVYAYPILLVIIFSLLGYFGFNGYSSFCFAGIKATTRNGNIVVIIVYYAPIFASMLLGTFFFLRVLSTLLTIWWLGPAFVRSRRPQGIRSKVADSSCVILVNPPAHRATIMPGGDGGGSAHQRPQLTDVVVVVATGGAGVGRGISSVLRPPMANDDGGGGGGDTSVIVPVDSAEALESLRRHQNKGREITTTIVAYCVIFLLTWSYLVAFRIRIFLDISIASSSYNAWKVCVFSNYDGISDSSWIGICGEQAEYYKSFYSSWHDPYVIVVTGQTLIVCVIFLREFFSIFGQCNKKKVVAGIDREVKRILEIRRSNFLRGIARTGEEKPPR